MEVYQLHERKTNPQDRIKFHNFIEERLMENVILFNFLLYDHTLVTQFGYG